eukprot:1141976-Pelagomonas_calceolata.AAC.9
MGSCEVCRAGALQGRMMRYVTDMGSGSAFTKLFTAKHGVQKIKIPTSSHKHIVFALNPHLNVDFMAVEPPWHQRGHLATCAGPASCAVHAGCAAVRAALLL